LRPARAEVDPDAGIFQSATAWKPGDGAIVGRHKIGWQVYKPFPDGSVPPIPTIPNIAAFHVTVIKRGKNHFNLKIDKEPPTVRRRP